MQVILALAPELAGLHLGGLCESQTGSLAPLMNFFSIGSAKVAVRAIRTILLSVHVVVAAGRREFVEGFDFACCGTRVCR